MNAGCLLMVGENEGRVLAARLRAGGIGVVRVETNTGIQEAALDGLRCARGKERTMIAASGEKVWGGARACGTDERRSACADQSVSSRMR